MHAETNRWLERPVRFADARLVPRVSIHHRLRPEHDRSRKTGMRGTHHPRLVVFLCTSSAHYRCSGLRFNPRAEIRRDGGEPPVDEEGKMHLPAGVQTVEESIKQTQLAQSGLKLGVVLVVGSYLLIILAGVLLIFSPSFAACPWVIAAETMGLNRSCHGCRWEALASNLVWSCLYSPPLLNWSLSFNSKRGVCPLKQNQRRWPKPW